jgi:hypothetical protein
VAFDHRSEELALAWVAMAGIALENALLYDEIRTMFDGFVEASVIAIESRDPTTSGNRARRHDVRRAGEEGRRRLRRAAGRRALHADHLQQLEYAGVLHDFGKVGVRERVLVKAKKLYEEDLRNIRLRFAYIKKGSRRARERKLRVALELGSRPGRAAGRHRRGSGRQMDEVDDALAFVARVNEPTVLDQGGFERLVEIARSSTWRPTASCGRTSSRRRSRRCRCGAAA